MGSRGGMGRVAVAAAALAAGAASCCGSGIAAQTIRGVVVDIDSSEPVALAYVGLLAPGRQLLTAALSDDRGRFSVTAPAAGSYLVYVARTGYRPLLDGLFELGEGGLLELEVRMTPAPLGLDPLTVDVQGGSRDLRSVGFYDRREMGFGHFIEREEIDRTAVVELADALRGVPGLRVYEPGVHPVAPTSLLRPEILVRRGGEYCSPTLYLDGQVVAVGGDRDRRRAVRPDDYVDPSEVEAVEIYTRPADTPPAYEATGGCGVILIWTRVW